MEEFQVFYPTKEKEERCECGCQAQMAVTERKAVFCSLYSQKKYKKQGAYITAKPFR